MRAEFNGVQCQSEAKGMHKKPTAFKTSGGDVDRGNLMEGDSDIDTTAKSLDDVITNADRCLLPRSIQPYDFLGFDVTAVTCYMQ
jgi:hypothetical protein